MDAERYCPGCGEALDSDAPGERCPACAKTAITPATVVMSTPHVGSGSLSDASIEPPEIAQIEYLSLLGEGGMGTVFRARQTHLDREVAVKVLRLDLLGDRHAEERFEQEARALAKLNHPNIVTVHDFGRTGSQCYLVMEFVDGVNLREAMETTRLSEREGMAVIGSVCEALQYAHDRGIVHRDMKPENVLLDRDGRVKIADFGLAKLADDSPKGARLTMTGQVMGTMHYMAPEQIERPLEVDHRADLYALGVIFYELLTSELPLGRFPLPSELGASDKRLDDLVLRALEKDPEKRFQSATEIGREIERISPRPGLPPAVPGPPVEEAEEPEAPSESRDVAGVTERYRRYGYGLIAGAFVIMYAGLKFDIFLSMLGFFLAALCAGMSCRGMAARVFRMQRRGDAEAIARHIVKLRKRQRVYVRLGLGFIAGGLLLSAVAGQSILYIFAMIGIPFCAIGLSQYLFTREIV